MNLADALRIMLPQLEDALVIHANGFISRVSFQMHDRPENFYMIGSMGLASSIGLGLAQAQPSRRVVVFDGDGNVLMNLGSLAMTAALKPRNFLHVCFDNAAYASTGAQRTVSSDVRLEEIARAAGYAASLRVSEESELASIFHAWLRAKGPCFLLVQISPDVEEHSLPRIEPEPEQLAERFRRVVLG